MSTPQSRRRWRERVFGFKAEGFLIGFGWGILASVVALAVVLLAGCGSSVTVAPGRAEVHQRTTTTVAPAGTVTRTVDTGGASVGAGGKATGDKTNLTGDGAPAPLTLPGGLGVAASSALFTLGATGSSMFANPLLWVGILLCIGGGAAIYFGLKRAAFVAFGVGGAFIVAAMLPGWAWVVIAAAVVAGGGFYVWSEWQAKRRQEALRAVVAGVANAPADAQAAVKAEVEKQADAADKAVISAIKRIENL